ncbi:hypothetical protein PoB_000920200 [Plakobranchus ocellatus]|uniref:Uncharacterized protein n=1 Tax=Plakobranchus ocellatus TaxID=259542 RepID=A0AAV3YIH5_9GAST|nr:hypothetical protein PoB_000920200 [Plakobranchus ocellatus]
MSHDITTTTNIATTITTKKTTTTITNSITITTTTDIATTITTTITSNTTIPPPPPLLFPSTAGISEDSPHTTEPSLERHCTELQSRVMATPEVHVSSEMPRTFTGIGLSSFLRK